MSSDMVKFVRPVFVIVVLHLVCGCVYSHWSARMVAIKPLLPHESDLSDMAVYVQNDRLKISNVRVQLERTIFYDRYFYVFFGGGHEGMGNLLAEIVVHIPTMLFEILFNNVSSYDYMTDFECEMPGFMRTTERIPVIHVSEANGMSGEISDINSTEHVESVKYLFRISKNKDNNFRLAATLRMRDSVSNVEYGEWNGSFVIFVFGNDLYIINPVPYQSSKFEIFQCDNTGEDIVLWRINMLTGECEPIASFYYGKFLTN